MFVDFLKSLNISPDLYLKNVKLHVKSSKYDPEKIEFSTRKGKKLMYKKDDGTYSHFGADKYKDYHIYKLLDGLEFANYRRNLFKKRHKYHVEKSTDKYSAAQLAYYVLW